jgi:hypothetical protein
MFIVFSTSAKASQKQLDEPLWICAYGVQKNAFMNKFSVDQ